METGWKRNVLIIYCMERKNNMMRPLHIIMPMAGEGSRFRKEGWTTPKPLIELNEMPLFVRAIQSVAISDVRMKYSFIVRQEHIDEYEIDKQIKGILPEANLFSVEKTTRGAVETCLLAESAIDRKDAVIIMDCDLEFRSTSFLSTIRNVLSRPATEVDGEPWFHLNRAILNIVMLKLMRIIG